MVKQISMASNLRKKCANNSNLHSPIKQQISRKPPTHRILNHPRKEETSATAKVEESRPKNLAKDRQLSAPNSDGNDLLQVYPFVEGPVVFNLGRGGYGDRLFHELQREISYERSNYGRRLPFGNLPMEMMKPSTSREDVFELSSEAEMVASFFKDNLF